MELKLHESITGHLKVSKNLGFHHTVPFLGNPARPYLAVTYLVRGKSEYYREINMERSQRLMA